jgi:GntR family transcriptional regulator
MTMNRQAGRRPVSKTERTVTPLYHQVYVILRQRIRNGELDMDRALPGENQLAHEFGVSRVTIRKTLHNLELDGFIVKRPSIGTFPVPQPVEFPNRYNIGGLAETGTDAKDRAKPTTLSIERIRAPGHIRNQLQPLDATKQPDHADEQQVLRLVRMRSIRGEPFTIMTAYFSAEHAADLDHRTLKKMPPPAALETIGVSLASAEQSISARNADETSAPLLHVPVGSALIFMGTVFRDRRDRPVIVLESLYRPDLYEYRSTMRRTRSGEWRER